jgi:translation initiation factor IF-2
MSDDLNPGVLGALPRTRPHRRSDKRAARPAPNEAPAASPESPATLANAESDLTTAGLTTAPAVPVKMRAAADPAARPAMPSLADPVAGPLATAMQAAAELAEIGLTASARALRGALSRLPRP